EVLRTRKKLPKFLRFLSHKTPGIQYQEKDIEYQITIDRRVKAFLPEITSSDESIDISRYFGSNAQEDKEAAYPQNSVAIEFKEPVEVAILPFHFRSPIHQLLTTELTQKMIKNILPGYQVDRGKAGHLSRGLNRLNLPTQ
ncbi:MAG: hypothetical protein ABI041_20815, partial [Bdellovibrionia bacterium]